MTTRFGLSEATIQKLCAVLAQYPQVEQAVLYGFRQIGDPDLKAHIQQAGVVFYQRMEPPPANEAAATLNG